MMSFMDWTYFNRDIRYDYTRWLLKTLSPAESQFLKQIRDTTDEQIEYVLDWINGNHEVITGFNTSSEWYEYFREESRLEMILLTLLQKYLEPSLVRSFYLQGNKLAYNHMKKNPSFLESDEQAFNNLNNYVQTVSNSIRSEFTDGIVKSIGDNIDNGNPISKIKTDIMDLRNHPINSPISINSRELFMAKTEYARAVNTGLLQSYANYGIMEYDWVTSGLPNTCKYCLEIENNNPYTLDEIISFGCPYHVNCACSVKARLPLNIHMVSNPRIIDLTPKK